MFGVEKRVERVRAALVRAFQAKSVEIMTKYAAVLPENIPKHDLARALIFHDLAEIIANLNVKKHPEDEQQE